MNLSEYLQKPGIKLIISIILTAIVVFILLKLIKRIFKNRYISKDKIYIRYAENLLKAVVIVIGFYWIIMSSPLTSSFGEVLFRGTALIGAVAGLAANAVIADLICGMVLSITKPFEIGNRIELEDGTSGIVKDITLRHVVLQLMDTAQMIVPNSKLNAMKITNLGKSPGLRSIIFSFHISYGSDIEKAMKVIRKAIEDSPLTVPGKPTPSGLIYAPIYFIDYADSSLVMKTTVYYTAENTTESVKSEVNTKVKHALDENGIEIPYPYINIVSYGNPD